MTMPPMEIESMAAAMLALPAPMDVSPVPKLALLEPTFCTPAMRLLAMKSPPIFTLPIWASPLTAVPSVW